MYKIIGGKKALINAIFERNSVDCILEKNKISWKIVKHANNNKDRNFYRFNNVYNWDSKKQVKEEALFHILQHFDYIENRLR